MRVSREYRDDSTVLVERLIDSSSSTNIKAGSTLPTCSTQLLTVGARYVFLTSGRSDECTHFVAFRVVDNIKVAISDDISAISPHMPPRTHEPQTMLNASTDRQETVLLESYVKLDDFIALIKQSRANQHR